MISRSTPGIPVPSIRPSTTPGHFCTSPALNARSSEICIIRRDIYSVRPKRFDNLTMWQSVINPAKATKTARGLLQAPLHVHVHWQIQDSTLGGDTPSLPFFYLPSLHLEVGPPRLRQGPGGALKLPSGSGRSPA